MPDPGDTYRFHATFEDAPPPQPTVPVEMALYGIVGGPRITAWTAMTQDTDPGVFYLDVVLPIAPGTYYGIARYFDDGLSAHSYSDEDVVNVGEEVEQDFVPDFGDC